MLSTPTPWARGQIPTKRDNPSLDFKVQGPLQTNKAKEAIKLFDVFHTLDREKLAKELVKHNDLTTKRLFIQVNTGKEKNKSGIYPEHLDEFVNYCVNDLSINIVGLMCIPPLEDKPKDHFSILEQHAKRHNLYQLSMGMSSDFKEAILFGATHIRIGEAIMGDRVG